MYYDAVRVRAYYVAGLNPVTRDQLLPCCGVLWVLGPIFLQSHCRPRVGCLLGILRGASELWIERQHAAADANISAAAASRYVAPSSSSSIPYLSGRPTRSHYSTECQPFEAKNVMFCGLNSLDLDKQFMFPL